MTGVWFRRRIGVFVPLAVFVALAVLFFVRLAGPAPGNLPSALAGKQIPDFSLPPLDGLMQNGVQVPALSASSLKGRVSIVNIWASWCGPCRDEAPIFETAWKRYRGKGALVLGLDLQDLSGNALAFLRENGITYPSLRDGTDASKRDLEATGVPETYIIDKRGRIALHITGQVTELRQITVPLDQVLAEK